MKQHNSHFTPIRTAKILEVSKNNIKHFIVMLDLQKESKICPKEKNMETSKLVNSKS